MKRVRVDRVELRLEGASRADAALLGTELGRALPAALHRRLLEGSEALRASRHVDAVRLRATPGASPAATAASVAGRVAESVRSAAGSRSRSTAGDD